MKEPSLLPVFQELKEPEGTGIDYAEKAFVTLYQAEQIRKLYRRIYVATMPKKKGSEESGRKAQTFNRICSLYAKAHRTGNDQALGSMNLNIAKAMNSLFEIFDSIRWTFIPEDLKEGPAMVLRCSDRSEPEPEPDPED